MEDTDLQANEKLSITCVKNEAVNEIQQEPASHTTNNKITLNLNSAAGTEEQSRVQLQEIPVYYQFQTPKTATELQWIITLSRYDFPWKDISFEPFTAKECYKQYRSLVKDAKQFLSKVLGEKEKFKRMMKN